MPWDLWLLFVMIMAAVWGAESMGERKQALENCKQLSSMISNEITRNGSYEMPPELVTVMARCYELRREADELGEDYPQ